LPLALGLGLRLRLKRWDAVALFHHLTTSFGVAKYAALCLASRAQRIAGLDNGRGWFLTERFRDDGFGERHEADYWLAVAGLLDGWNPEPTYEVPVTPADRAWADQQVARLLMDGAGVLAIHPGSGAFSLARRWPPERFATVVRALVTRHDLRPMLIQGPGPDESLLARAVAVAAGGAEIVGPAPTIGALVALLEHVRLFVGNESGVMHLAVTAGAPIVAIFGPTNDRAWGPYPLAAPRHAVVRESLACTPCVHRGHAFGTPAGCAARTCIDLIEPDAVLAAAERVLARTGERDQWSAFPGSAPVGAS
jgi:heptosyltransferase-2